mmetsp:Transcript_53933/g.85841  ORF Transcript_53933/g.85841 Transcript_53933/m.85841 type:complete len:149 (-) Transcript_53933:158-604(-)
MLDSRSLVSFSFVVLLCATVASYVFADTISENDLEDATDEQGSIEVKEETRTLLSQRERDDSIDDRQLKSSKTLTKSFKSGKHGKSKHGKGSSIGGLGTSAAIAIIGGGACCCILMICCCLAAFGMFSGASRGSDSESESELSVLEDN